MKLTDELIDDYILGALSASEKTEFEGLLKSDASARARLDEATLLLEMLDSSAPEVPSKLMWNGIRAQITATAVPQISIWSGLADWFAGPRLRLGLAGAMTLFFVVIGLRHMRQPALPPEVTIEEKTAPAAAPLAKRVEDRPAAAAAAVQVAKAEAPKKSVMRGPTEVEKALSEQDLDGVIATMLRERQTASIGASSRGGLGNGVQTVAYGGAPAPSMAREARVDVGNIYDSSQALPAAQSRVDANGFWDFHAAAVALNRRDWLSASRELQAASASAPEAAERAFARSTLQLLSAGGQPVVAKVDMGESRELNVQSAARWQVFVDNHVARYFGGVVASMPGLRSEGNELLLDMAFDRASFSPGTKFVKLAEDEGVASQVKDSMGETVSATEFRAPRGAEYLLRANELRLK